MAQSVLGAAASIIYGLDTDHVPTPAREPDLDFVFTAGDQQIPVQVNYRRSLDPVRDTRGIRAFVENPAKRAPFGLLITREDTPAIDDLRIVAMPLSTFMFLGLDLDPAQAATAYDARPWPSAIIAIPKPTPEVRDQGVEHPLEASYGREAVEVTIATLGALPSGHHPPKRKR